MKFVIRGSVKDHLKKNKLRIASATYEALDLEFQNWLEKASERAKKNKRLTVMPQDL